jgi:hypothetical protein
VICADLFSGNFNVGDDRLVVSGVDSHRVVTVTSWQAYPLTVVFHSSAAGVFSNMAGERVQPWLLRSFVRRHLKLRICHK